MAIDYPRLFADIGSFITAINQIRDTAVQLNSPRPDLIALERDHQNQLTATTASTSRGRFSVLSGVDESYVTIKDLFVAQCDTLAAYVTDRLLDVDTVVSQLPGMGSGVNIDRILVELYNDMLANSQTVFQSNVSIGSVTVEAVDNGNPARPNQVGTVFLTKRLDGENAPGADLETSILYAGEDSELVVETEELLWSCTGDQYDSATGDGGEIFQLESRPQPGGGRFTWRTEGSGESISLTNFNNVGTLLVNKDFELWVDSATPSSWTVDNGTVQQTTSPATDVFRGDSSLRFEASGRISQAQTGLQPRNMYVATIAHRAAVAGTNLRLFFEGTMADGSSYAPAGEEIFDGPISDSWSQSAIFYLVPDQPMVDARLVVEAGGELWIDSMTLGLVQWIGGVGTCVVAGQEPWITGDRLKVTISNDDAGKFQQFWRKYYRRQLPSSATGTITEPSL